MRMMDQTKAFPRKVNVDQYKEIIDAAQKAAPGEDHLPRVVIEDYETYKLATRAANCIRKYSKDNSLNLRVSCPEGGRSIFVYKSSTVVKSRTRKKNVPAESENSEEPEIQVEE